MAFPVSPSEGALYTIGAKRYRFTNGGWKVHLLSSIQPPVLPLQLSAGSTLPVSMNGGLVVLSGTTGYVTTLPDASVVPGFKVDVYNGSSVSQTVSAPNGHFYGPSGTGRSTLNIPAGQKLSLFGVVADYVAVGSAFPGLSALYSYSTPGTFTFTVPDGLFDAKVTAIGAGGGGSGTSTQTTTGSGGGGGGGGGAAIKFIRLNPGDTHAVTVGAGGVGAATNAATAGGLTSFDGLVIATGGSFGGPWESGQPAGGNPGVGQVGDLHLTGSYGTDGGVSYGGYGGNPPIIGSGSGRGGEASGLPGSYGAGGGGAYLIANQTVPSGGASGANGGPGLVLIEPISG